MTLRGKTGRVEEGEAVSKGSPMESKSFQAGVGW